MASIVPLRIFDQNLTSAFVMWIHYSCLGAKIRLIPNCFFLLFSRSVADLVRRCFSDSLPGPFHQFYFRLQHHHEGLLSCLIHRHSLPHVRQIQSNIRSQPRHFQVRQPHIDLTRSHIGKGTPNPSTD